MQIIKSLLAVAGGIAALVAVAGAAPATAATVYKITDHYQTEYGSGALEARLTISDVESEYKGYYAIEGLTLDSMIFSGTNYEFNYATGQRVPVPYTISVTNLALGNFNSEGPSFFDPVSRRLFTDAEGEFRAVGFYDDTSYYSALISNLNDYNIYVVVSYGRYSTSFGTENLTLTQVGAGAVPEPASWAMMIGGFGLVGGAMRRRSAQTRLA